MPFNWGESHAGTAPLKVESGNSGVLSPLIETARQINPGNKNLLSKLGLINNVDHALGMNGLGTRLVSRPEVSTVTKVRSITQVY